MQHDHLQDNELNWLPGLTQKVIDCIGCGKTLPVTCFKRDSSYKYGRRDLCDMCANSPRLSTSEHVSRQREINYRAAEGQRWAYQDDYRNDEARVGRVMHHSEFFDRLRKKCPGLFVIPGQIKGDWAVYQVFGQPQPKFEGRSFNYLGWLGMGTNLEYSQYLFDEERNIAIKEKTRGWRTVLLRMIKAGMLTEDEAHKIFGPPTLGLASIVYRRTLWEHRNNQKDQPK